MDAEDRKLLTNALVVGVVGAVVLLYAAAVLGLAVLVFRTVGGV